MRRFTKRAPGSPDLFVAMQAVMPANPDGPWFEFTLAERSRVTFRGHAQLELRDGYAGCMVAWQVWLGRWDEAGQCWVPFTWDVAHGPPGYAPGAKGGGNITGHLQHYAEVYPEAVLWDTRDPATGEEWGLGPGRYRVELHMRSADATQPERNGAAQFKAGDPAQVPAPGPYNCWALEIEPVSQHAQTFV